MSEVELQKTILRKLESITIEMVRITSNLLFNMMIID